MEICFELFNLLAGLTLITFGCVVASEVFEYLCGKTVFAAIYDLLKQNQSRK